MSIAPESKLVNYSTMKNTSKEKNIFNPSVNLNV